MQHLLKQAQGLEITLVDTEKRKPSLGLQPLHPRTFARACWRWPSWGPPRRRLGPLPLAAARLPMLFVLGVLATALTTSLMPAILAAVLGFVGHNLLFTAPTSL